MIRVRSASSSETRALGEAVAALLRPGDVVALAGDIGAGKTTFAQGAARGLGVTEAVVSPTFTLVREYEGRVPVVHVDVFRLDRVQELHDIGFEELLDGGAVTFVEWGDVVMSLLPPERLDVRLGVSERDAPDDERVISLDPVGGYWIARREALEAIAATFDVTA